jgi:hypothetical protein
MTSTFDRSTGPSPLASCDWESTRLQTQLATRLAGADDDATPPDIGQPVGNDQRELFVACDPAEAMLQQFEHLRLEFVAVQDLGTHVSRKLIAGIAAATSQPVQRLVIRRPGGGLVLATLEFIDLPASHGGKVRLYSTMVEADTTTRQSLMRLLLGRSQLGVVMVGDLPGHALASALEPWQFAAQAGDWACRRLLFMPLAASGTVLADEITRFRGVTRLDCTTTPRVTRPAEVWTYLCTAWNLMQRSRQPGAAATALPLLGSAVAVPAPDAAAAQPPAASAPMPMPMPVPMPMPIIGAAPPSRDALLERYLHDLGQLPGVVSACVFQASSGHVVGHAGARPGPDELARHGSMLLEAMTAASRAMGLGATVPEVTITLGQHHLLLRPVPAHPGMALHAVLDRPHATLALVLVQLRRLDEDLLTAARGSVSAAPARS